VRRGALITVALMSLALGGTAAAQDYPNRPITIVMQFPAGGTADAAIRLFADAVGRSLGQRVVIDNRSGGGGTVAAMAVKQARPDGYTLRLIDIGADVILPALQSVPYDPSKDFAPIALLMSWGQFLTVPAASPAYTVAELVALARAESLTYGSQGFGSGGHLLGAMFQMATGTRLVHVPYKGGGPLQIDLIAGRIGMGFTSYREMRQHLEDGKVRMLALAAARRSPLAPDVPTFAELGLAGIELSPWFGLAAPAGTPTSVLQTLHDAFAQVAKDEALLARLNREGIDVHVSTPAELGALIAADSQRLHHVIKSQGIKAE
jgi:tripartite-type tricarboxylate transporter receptor subunit TctC